MANMEQNESGTGAASGAPNGQRGTTSEAATRNLGQRINRINDGAQQAWQNTRESVDEIKDRLDIQGRVDRNPYGMVAAAVGVGYVLGGGIFSPLTAKIVGFGLKMGLRLAAIPFIKDELLGVVAAATGDSGGGESESAAATTARKMKQSANTNKGRQQP